MNCGQGGKTARPCACSLVSAYKHFFQETECGTDRIKMIFNKISLDHPLVLPTVGITSIEWITCLSIQYMRISELVYFRVNSQTYRFEILSRLLLSRIQCALSRASRKAWSQAFWQDSFPENFVTGNNSCYLLSLSSRGMHTSSYKRDNRHEMAKMVVKNIQRTEFPGSRKGLVSLTSNWMPMIGQNTLNRNLFSPLNT